MEYQIMAAVIGGLTGYAIHRWLHRDPKRGIEATAVFSFAESSFSKPLWDEKRLPKSAILLMTALMKHLIKVAAEQYYRQQKIKVVWIEITVIELTPTSVKYSLGAYIRGAEDGVEGMNEKGLQIDVAKVKELAEQLY